MNQLKCTDFISGITHDLKSPLNGILGYIQIAMIKLNKLPNIPQDVIDELFLAMNIGKDMNKLIHNMLTVARMQSGNMPITPVKILRQELVEQINSLEKTFEAEAASKNIDFIVTYGRLPNSVVWDIQSLRYFVINNIVSNALKFTGIGGKVYVHVESNIHDWVSISVSDNGPGIPYSDREAIFDQFSQASNNKLHSSMGSGYGLFNAAYITQTHKGTITVNDGIGGQGVKFEVVLQTNPFRITENEAKTGETIGA